MSGHGDGRTARAEDSHIARARERLETRARERAGRREVMRHRALQEAEAIVAMIATRYRPARIYQWGSVLRPGGFRDYSDVDVAVEGIDGARTFFAMLADTQAMTRLPLDLVQVERIAPEHTDEIRQHGRVVYERR